MPKNEFIFHFGDTGEYFYIVFKGRADIYVSKTEENIAKEREIIANIERATTQKNTAVSVTE